MALGNDPFKAVDRKLTKKKFKFSGGSYFNTGGAGTAHRETQDRTTGTGSVSTTIFTKPPPAPPPSTTVTPPVTPVTPAVSPSTTITGTQYFKTPQPPVTIGGSPGRVNPPPAPATNPWAIVGSNFDPQINPTTFYEPTANLRTQLQNSRHGFTNADRQLWQDFLDTVTTGYKGDMHARKVQQMMQSPDGWLKLAQEYMLKKGLYTPPTTTNTNTDYSQFMVDAPTMSQQLLANEGLRTRYLQNLNQTFGSQLSMPQFMAILNSSSGAFAQIHERLRKQLGTGDIRPPTGGLGG